jgi:hypothetical protein
MKTHHIPRPGPPSTNTLQKILATVRSREDLKDRLVHVERMPAQDARFGVYPGFFPPELVRVLQGAGLGAAYTHQAAA